MEFVIPGTKPDPPLRIAGRRVNLTYAALFPGELTFDILLAACRRWAATRGGLREYAFACGREQHPNPADPLRPEHFHLYGEFGKVVDISDRRHTNVFDSLARSCALGRSLSRCHVELRCVPCSNTHALPRPYTAPSLSFLC